MKKLKQLLLSIAAGLMSAAMLTTPTLAASVTFEGDSESFIMAPGSSYTSTDLFDGFKNMAPGDSRTETITVKADKLKKNQYVKIYMRAVAHDASNPLSPNVGSKTTLSEMEEFLSKLEMTVKNGSTTIFHASPEKLGGLADNVLLGTFESGDSIDLTVTLTLPVTLNNDYKNRVGEVDWVFKAEVLDKTTPIFPRVPTVTLEAEKLVDGKTPTESFTFQLRDSDGKLVDSATNNGRSITFSSMSFDRTGTYTYYITEQAGDDLGMSYDSSEYKITINVTKPKLDYEASVSVEKDGIPYIGTITFNNTTTPIKPTPGTVQVKLNARKLLDGKTPSESFTFRLADENGKLIERANNDGGSISFKAITLTGTGTYTYTINEVNDGNKSINYDTAKYTATVTVVEVNGMLSASVTYQKDGASYRGTPLFNNTTVGETILPIDPDETTAPDTDTDTDTETSTTDTDTTTIVPEETTTTSGNPDVPKTGDDTNDTIWRVMLGVGVLCMVGVVVIGLVSRRKEQKS